MLENKKQEQIAGIISDFCDGTIAEADIDIIAMRIYENVFKDTKWQKLEKWLNDRMEHYNDCLNENVLISSEMQEVLSARYNQCFETIAQMEYIEKELEGEDDL